MFLKSQYSKPIKELFFIVEYRPDLLQMNRNFCSRLMERRYVKWLAGSFILLLAVYIVQHPKYAPEYLKQEIGDKVVVICGASSGEYHRI